MLCCIFLNKLYACNTITFFTQRYFMFYSSVQVRAMFQSTSDCCPNKMCIRDRGREGCAHIKLVLSYTWTPINSTGSKSPSNFVMDHQLLIFLHCNLQQFLASELFDHLLSLLQPFVNHGSLIHENI